MTEIIEEKTKPVVDRTLFYDQADGLVDEASILDVLDEELKQHGYAGPTNIARLTYLVTFSRTLDRPCSLVIKGPSSSGKSFALDAALRYVVPSAYKYVSGMSDMALVHSGWDLRGRHLVIGEAAGMSDGRGRTYTRQLMSDGNIVYATVQQTKEGHSGKELPKVQGPAGVIMTTTAPMLHPEDETRFLSVHINQSPERIRETLIAQARGEIRKPSAEHLSRWHALHEFCFTGCQSAYIPFLPELAASLPVGDHRVFRDFQQVKSLIGAHALLHQGRRESKGKQVIATIFDYAKVYELVQEPLSQGLRVSVAPHIRDVVVAVTACSSEPGNEGGVSQGAVARHMGRNPSVVSRNIRAAIALGYVKNHGYSGPGNEALLVPGETMLPSSEVLPSPAELHALVRR